MSALFLDQLRPQALEVDVPGHGGRVEVEVLDDVAQREAEGDGQDGPFGVGDDAGARFNRKHFGLNFWFKFFNCLRFRFYSVICLNCSFNNN